MNEILTLILAPLSVGLLLLYLQQLGKVKELRDEAEGKKEKVTELLKKLKDTSAQYEEALRAAREHYDHRVDQSSDEVTRLIALSDAQKEVIRAIVKAYDTMPRSLRSGSTLLQGASTDENA